MKRAYRLSRPEQFQRVRREGWSVSHPLIRLTVAPNRGKQPRCGFVVSKRIGKKAVQRNRAKRRVREAVRLTYEHIVSGFDLVFVIRTVDVTEVSFSLVQAVVEELLRRARVWYEPTHLS